ncbi:acireductone synthase [Hyphomicrobium sp.]|uniref:acireductone synthase n=1 Tax=Hyphomicrobium sp. TaxID=82 RepID=UPI0025B971E2|nr:acireductone synthase [Hyphomicrobium sp.]
MSAEATQALQPTLERAPLRINVAAVLLDIEGTLSPISFVQDVLFPYAKAKLRDYLSANASDPAVRDILAQARDLSGAPDAIAAIEAWQANDVKAPPLKKLQGMIWDSGYRSGAFVSPIFPDALAAFRRWHVDGFPLYIYSSGSVQAQHLFFEFTEEGNLRSLFEDYFDTEIGPKTDLASYQRIADQIGRRPQEIVFMSDNVKELEAARDAGLATVHVLKDRTPSTPDFREISDYSEITLGLNPAS